MLRSNLDNNNANIRRSEEELKGTDDRSGGVSAQIDQTRERIGQIQKELTARREALGKLQQELAAMKEKESDHD